MIGITSTVRANPIYAELERHDTGWVACSDWTQSKFGDTFGNDVVHNFDTPLSHLLVTFLFSPTGADNDCFIIHTALGTVVSEQTGLSLVGVDNDSLYFRSGLNGIRYTHPSGALFLLSTSSWYYKIVVTKPQGVVPISNRNVLTYATGWVACSDWTDQQLGTAVGGNVIHNLNGALSDIIVKVLVSTDGTDTNSFDAGIYSAYDDATGDVGLTIYQVDNNTITVQTATQGVWYTDNAGAIQRLDTENWYYKIKVWYMG